MPSNEDRRYQILIDQGDDEELIFIYKDSEGAIVNLTGVVAEFIVDWGFSRNEITGVQIGAAGSITLSSPSNGITITPAEGKISVRLTDDQTSTIPLSGVFAAINNVSYQLRLTWPGSGYKETLIAGPLRVFRDRF